jgi:uncharacterized phage protein (TIGR02218 family)
MSSLAETLAGEVTRLALCWRLTRADGVVLGFTSHDTDLLLEGVRYLSSPGMTPSAVSQEDGLRPDSMDIEGVLDAAAIRACDLDAGRWTGARVELLACDWSLPEAGMMRILRGSIGDISRPFPGASGAFRAALLSDAAGIDMAGPVRLSPMCRAELGDGLCGVEMDSRRIEVLVAGAAADRLYLATSLSAPADFAAGRLRIIDGPLSGIDRRISRVSGLELVVDEPLPAAVERDTRAWIWEGCDKRFATCAGRFGNALAFVGEPQLPGSDALMRYADG